MRFDTGNFSCFLCILAPVVHGSVTNDRKNFNDEKYLSFDEYVHKFHKSWSDNNNVEYDRRRSIYEHNLKRVQEHNQNRRPTDHWLGIDAFTDMEPQEVFMGYDKSHKQRAKLFQKEESKIQLYDRLEQLTGVRLDDPIDSLPLAVDWRKEGVTTPVKNQGMCGSCWAFASTAVLESHLAIQTATLFELSVQELISCTPNEHHCGGTGGCAGSTAELAFNEVVNHGMVTEWQFGYQSYHPNGKLNCSLSVGSKSFVAAQQRGLQPNPTFYVGAVMAIKGWVSLPSNDYVAVMNAVAKLGPLAVSVACHPWLSYQGGVVESSNFTEPSDTDVNHLVVLEGYGTDETTGFDYWLVRNSWGPRWGEGGYIRLRRMPEEDKHCGMDVTPADGVACTTDNNGEDVTPPDALICGNSGILYDVSVPLQAFLV